MEFGGQALGGGELAGEVGVGVEDAEALFRRGSAEGAGEGGVEAGRGVVGGAELEGVGALGDPGRVLEDAAEAGDEGVAAEGGRGARRSAAPGGGRASGAAISPRVASQAWPRASDVVEEAGEAGGAAGAADEAAVQADRHHLRRAGGALGPEGVEGVAQVDEEVLAGLSVPAEKRMSLVSSE